MPRLFSSLEDLKNQSNQIIGNINSPQVLDETKLRSSFIDDLIYNALFQPDEEIKQKINKLIYLLADACNAKSSSIFPLYNAVGQGELVSFVVPAINIRCLTYDTARRILQIMTREDIGVIIFEIARSEMGYTEQSPKEFALSILAAAIKEGYKDPIFIQGDHFQFNKNLFVEDEAREINNLKTLISDAVQAKFYNIDIDASTLVDLTKPDLKDQQEQNAQMTALLIKYIRQIQPKNTVISIGGEIGHIGDKNSTLSDFEAFMTLFKNEVPKNGISKVSVQTGSSHGGTPLPDGTLKKVEIDFSVLKSIGKVAKDKYHLAGAVQHGASTLPIDNFGQLKDSSTIEVHLATGLQNIVYDNLPNRLKEEMYSWITTHLSQARLPEQTEEQFIYKNRKKALGQFKKDLWDLSETEKARILDQLESYLLPIFTGVGVLHTRQITDPYFL